MCFVIKTKTIFDPQISVASFWFSEKWKHCVGLHISQALGTVSPAPVRSALELRVTAPILGHSGL